MNDTLRNNVLFGEAYEEEKYNRVIALSQMGEDIN